MKSIKEFEAFNKELLRKEKLIKKSMKVSKALECFTDDIEYFIVKKRDKE